MVTIQGISNFLQNPTNLLLIAGLAGSYFYVLRLRRDYELRGHLPESFHREDLWILVAVIFGLFLYFSLTISAPFWIYGNAFSENLFHGWLAGVILWAFLAALIPRMNYPAGHLIYRLFTDKDPQNIREWETELLLSVLVGGGYTTYIVLFKSVAQINIWGLPLWLELWAFAATTTFAALYIWRFIIEISNFVYDIPANRSS